MELEQFVHVWIGNVVDLAFILPFMSKSYSLPKIIIPSLPLAQMLQPHVGGQQIIYGAEKEYHDERQPWQIVSLVNGEKAYLPWFKST